MKLKRRFAKRGRVEVIPMIDTILILLIFYMTFSSFNQKEKRIDAKMPSLSTQPPPSAREIQLDIVLHVFDKNNIRVGNAQSFDVKTLRDAMKTFISGTTLDKVTVVIEAEPGTQYNDVIGALDACALAHLTKVAFRPLADSAAPAPLKSAAIP